jgi:hypothetical protein
MPPLLRTTSSLTVVVLAAIVASCDAPQSADLTAPRAVAPSAAVAANAAETFTQNESIPIDLVAFVSCANGGAGELVFMSGDLHVLTHYTLSSSGTYHVKQHFQPQGISGYGEISGDKYQATGGTQEEFNENGPFPITDTYINNFRIIGQGPDNNFLIHENVHITINANGVLTSYVDNFTVDCK